MRYQQPINTLACHTYGMERIESDARMTRGLELSKTATIAENEDGTFTVPSQTSSDVYQVKILGRSWVCSCPDFENASRPD